MNNGTTIDLLNEEQGLAILKKFGEVIRRRRVELNLTQEQFSMRAGLHRTYVSNVERGERNLTLLTAIRISQGLELTLLELLTRTVHDGT
jgi:transcriptional regulator with XRE-family HTH domain